jgi:hypothetical protein
MAKLSELFEEKAKATLQIGGTNVEVRWYGLWRRRFSDDEWKEQVLTLSGRDYLRFFLPRVLVSWDVTDDNGLAIPTTAEAFDQYDIPDQMLYAIERRVITSDSSGKALPVTSNNSPAS